MGENRLPMRGKPLSHQMGKGDAWSPKLRSFPPLQFKKAMTIIGCDGTNLGVEKATHKMQRDRELLKTFKLLKIKNEFPKKSIRRHVKDRMAKVRRRKRERRF
jgi:hypothetical protein